MFVYTIACKRLKPSSFANRISCPLSGQRIRVERLWFPLNQHNIRPRLLTHMWFTGYVSHSFILRICWEGMETPSAEARISAFFGCAYDEYFKDRED